ncbi:MAG: LamG domain-containing protein [Firmicutes bacterium]|nr:LamG domain-containing protein [Bacillota bacterium]
MKRIFALVVAVAMIATLCVFTSADEVTDGLVAHYELSSDLKDSVGSADGTLTYTPVTNTAEVTEEATFTDGALTIAQSSTFGVKFPVTGITSDFTVSVELTILGSLQWASPFVWIGGTDQSTENWIGIWSGFSNGTETFVEVGSNDAGGNRYAVASGLTQTPTSTITVTLTVASNVASYYINGELVGSTENMPNPWEAEDCAIYIAANAWGDADTNASYNNLYVYSRALTADEVSTLVGETQQLVVADPDAALDAITGTKVTVNEVIDDGNGTWGSSTDTTSDHVFDGDTSTFYDGAVEEAWVGAKIDSTVISTVAIYARSANYDRIANAVIQGSNDGENWTDLYTIETAVQNEWIICDITDTTAYTYVRVYNCGYGNVAEMNIYTASSSGTNSGSNTGSNTGTQAPQTGFAFVGLGVVALASGAAIVVSKKRH